jgi:hypothetical protein
MDRRREIRVEANEPVVVTEVGANRHHRMGGMIHDVSGSGMLIKLARALAVDALVRVEASSMLLLAEVVRCEADGEGFRVALMIRHSLQNLALENLNTVLLEAGRAAGAEQVEQQSTPIKRQSAPIMRE